MIAVPFAAAGFGFGFGDGVLLGRVDAAGVRAALGGRAVGFLAGAVTDVAALVGSVLGSVVEFDGLAGAAVLQPTSNTDTATSNSFTASILPIRLRRKSLSPMTVRLRIA